MFLAQRKHLICTDNSAVSTRIRFMVTLERSHINKNVLQEEPNKIGGNMDREQVMIDNMESVSKILEIHEKMFRGYDQRFEIIHQMIKELTEIVNDMTCQVRQIEKELHEHET